MKEPKDIIKQLELNQNVIISLFSFLSESEYNWKPNPQKWNLLEILVHLCDEEKEDFLTRIQYALNNFRGELPPIDPEGWVKERKYADEIYNKQLERWIKARKESIQFLKTLKNPNWNNTLIHPQLGELSAHLFLANWLAHDYLHIRQILKLKYQYLATCSQQDLGYAGDW